jgi:hypothetical protein
LNTLGFEESMRIFLCQSQRLEIFKSQIGFLVQMTVCRKSGV